KAPRGEESTPQELPAEAPRVVLLPELRGRVARRADSNPPQLLQAPQHLHLPLPESLGLQDDRFEIPQFGEGGEVTDPGSRDVESLEGGHLAQRLQVAQLPTVIEVEALQRQALKRAQIADTRHAQVQRFELLQLLQPPQVERPGPFQVQVRQ